MAASGATLALAAIGQTIVVLSGGFDLSAGAAISLVNVALASSFQDPTLSPLVIGAAGVGIGMVSGAFNGFFVAVLRMQPIVVTLATMFILQGVTLLIMDKPGGQVSPALSDLLIGDAIPNLLPKPTLLIVIVLAALGVAEAHQFRRRHLRGRQRPRTSARAVGVRTRLVQFMVYVIAGGCYGLAGVFISAQTGSADPLIGNPMLLQMFAAVVVGGTMLGGGRGGPLGTVFGAYMLMMVVNILLVLNVSAYYSTVAEGSILILAVLGGSARAGLRRSAATCATSSCTPGRARTGGCSLRSAHAEAHFLSPAQTREGRATRGERHARTFLVRNAEALRFALPAYVCFALVVVATQLEPRPRADELVLLQLAHRADVVPGRAGARSGLGDPDRRPRPLRAVDDRLHRHPACRHGQGLGRGAALRAADRASGRRWPSASSMAPASSCSASRRSS